MRMLRTHDVLLMLGGISRTTFWSLRKRGGFPAGRVISKNIMVWSEEEILAWIESRPCHDVGVGPVSMTQRGEHA